eukprot:2348126-Pleurochrysis_carterae.AAC.1
METSLRSTIFPRLGAGASPLPVRTDAAAAAPIAAALATAAPAAAAAADVKDPAQPSPTVGTSAKSPFGFVPMLERMSSDWKGDKFWKVPTAHCLWTGQLASVCTGLVGSHNASRCHLKSTNEEVQTSQIVLPC